MTQKDFNYVQTLARTLNFTHAADALGITQPSLSQYIKKLEQEFGVELFIRHGQNIRLTDAGAIFLEAAKDIMAIEHQMQASFLDLMECKAGSLIVGTSPYRCASMMSTVVAEFAQQYPGIQIAIEEATTAELMEDAEHGKYDLCITMLPVNERIFAYEKLRNEELILAVPSTYPALPARSFPDRKYPAVEMAAIDGQRFIMVTEAQVMQRELNNLCADYGLKLNTAVTVKSLEAQIEMVRAGVGMALLPSGIEHFCANGEVTFYSFTQELPPREVIAMWPKARPLTQTARSLVDCIKKITW